MNGLKIKNFKLKINCYNMDYQERWQSGRMRTLGKRIWQKCHRGFESPLLRIDFSQFDIIRI